MRRIRATGTATQTQMCCEGIPVREHDQSGAESGGGDALPSEWRPLLRSDRLLGLPLAPELTKERLHSVALLQRGVFDIELGIVPIAARLVLSTVELADNRLDLVYGELAVILRLVALHPLNLGSAAAVEAMHDSLTIDLPAI